MATRSQKAIKETIIIGSDHQGFQMKEFIKAELAKRSIEVKDVGAFSSDQPSDYPESASKVAGAISAGTFGRGIVIDGSGIGASVVCNRFPRVRAALCNTIAVAKIARGHMDSNVLVLAGRLTPEWDAAQILDAWLGTAFEGGRHAERLRLIDDNTQLSLACHHFGEVNPEKIEIDSVNQPFLMRALHGLEKVVAQFGHPLRRDEEELRRQGTYPTQLTHEGRKYSGYLVNLSANGMQMRLKDMPEYTPLLSDDPVELSIKTPYGMATCTGAIKWMDAESSTIGIAFVNRSKDPKDPLAMMLDSVL